MSFDSKIKVSNNTLYIIIPYFNFSNNPTNIRFTNLILCLKQLFLQLLSQKTCKFKIIIAEACLENDTSKKLSFQKIVNILKMFVNVESYFEVIHFTIKQKLWIKENIINVVVQNYLPQDWKYFVWLDGDVAFLNPNWPQELAYKFNNDNVDVIQMFQHLCYLDSEYNVYADQDSKQHFENISLLQIGMMYMYSPDSEKDDGKRGNMLTYSPYWGAPGMAWSINRSFYDKIGGLFEFAIAGEADFLQVRAWHPNYFTLFNKSELSLDRMPYSAGYRDFVYKFAEKSKEVKIGYLTGNLIHYFHGTISSRKYGYRLGILHKHNFDPRIHLLRDEKGILNIHPNCKGLIADLEEYFKQRED